jgi:hypothetical protein
VRAVPALWPKVVSFTVEELGVNFAEPAADVGWNENPPIVYVEDGVLGNLMEITQRLYKANFPGLMEQIDVANTTEDAVRHFMFVVEPADGEELQIEVDGMLRILYLS